MMCTKLVSRSLSHSFSIKVDQHYADIKPSATDAQILRAGHYCVVGFAIFMAAFGSMLHGVKIDLGFIYNMTGIFTGSALPALIATFFSTRQGSLAAVASIWTGFFSAVITWVRSFQLVPY